MKIKIFLVILAITLFTASVVSAIERKAIIYQDPENRYYYLVDPDARVALSHGHGYITIDPQGHFIGHSLYVGDQEILDHYLHHPVRHIYYHEEYKLDGLRIGRIGSCKYVLEPMTAEAKSKGYHEIYFEKGKLMGKVGTTKEEIKLDQRCP